MNLHDKLWIDLLLFRPPNDGSEYLYVSMMGNVELLRIKMV